MPRFGSLRSYEQLDALATRYHCLPSDVLRTSYAEYCVNEACAIAGEARDARQIEEMRQNAPSAPAPDAPPGTRVFTQRTRIIDADEEP